MDEYNYRQSVELWLVHGRIVATQQSYVHKYLKEKWHEVKNYYCTRCGDVWGRRVDPSFPPSYHYYYKSKCTGCGGKDNMLTPWEWDNLEVLGPNVIAYLILQENNDG